jgi:hypothetical protein
MSPYALMTRPDVPKRLMRLFKRVAPPLNSPINLPLKMGQNYVDK